MAPAGLCSLCNKKTGGKTISLECQSCAGIQHAKCLGIPDEFAACIKGYECMSCKTKAQEAEQRRKDKEANQNNEYEVARRRHLATLDARITTLQNQIIECLELKSAAFAQPQQQPQQQQQQQQPHAWQQHPPQNGQAPADYCICHSAFEDGRPMVLCETCERWMHLACVNLTQQQADATPNYECPDCAKAANANANANASEIVKSQSPAKPASPAFVPNKQSQIRYESDLKDTEERIACVCSQSQPSVPLVQCDACKLWQHQLCCGITKQQMDRLTHWFCDKCAPHQQQQQSLPQSAASPVLETRSLNEGTKVETDQQSNGTAAAAQALMEVGEVDHEAMGESGEVLYCKCRKPDQGDQGKSSARHQRPSALHFFMLHSRAWLHC